MARWESRSEARACHDGLTEDDQAKRPSGPAEVLDLVEVRRGGKGMRGPHLSSGMLPIGTPATVSSPSSLG